MHPWSVTLRRRALLAFLALPCTVAGVAPALLARADPGAGPGSALALLPFTVGFAVVLACVRDFLVIGGGTLAPWDPPRRLVVVGLYRWVRNPMYLGVLGILKGWAVATGSTWLWIYLAVVAVGFHLRVVLAEEPWQERQFGDQWRAYARSVHRWLPWPPAPGAGASPPSAVRAWTGSAPGDPRSRQRRP